MPLFQVCRTITYDYTYEVEAKDEDEAIDFTFEDKVTNVIQKDFMQLCGV